ncbi:hypothetical protein, partial [Acinetobacter sp. YH12120]|uniref:hypothetical protein n=1 Tax=Acinetobacter sp. YH12120 TaxID=2601107 RepID=UPI001C553CFE
MATKISVLAVNGMVLQLSAAGIEKKVSIKSKLSSSETLVLSKDSSVIVKLPDGRIVEIKGKDLIDQEGVFSLQQFAEQNTTLTDLEKLQEFAQQYKNIEFHESNDHIIRLEDGRIFKKSGKDYVEVQPELENITDNQGGHRFVQVAKLDQISIADGINPLRLDRVVDNIPPLNTLYPTIDYPTTTDYAVPVVEKPVTTSKYHPQASVNDVYQYEGGELIHTVTISGQGNNPTKVIVTISNSNTDLGIDTGIIEYSTDGGKTWTSTHISEGSFEVNVPKGNSSFLVKIPSISDNVFEGPESYEITVTTSTQDQPSTGTGTIVDDGSIIPVDPSQPYDPETNPQDPNKGTPDDDRPVATVDSVTEYEGNDLIHTVTVTPSTTDTTVTVTVTGTDVEPGKDTGIIEYSTDGGETWTSTEMTEGSFDVIVPPGGTEVLVKVPSEQDPTFEGPESYEITVTTSTQDKPSTGKGTIVDDGSIIPVDPSQPYDPETNPQDPNKGTADDDRPQARITDAATYEGESLTHIVTLSNESITDTVVTVNLGNGSATLGTDTDAVVTVEFADGSTQEFTPDASGNFTVIVPAGDTGFKVIVSSTDDTTLEGVENYNISVKTPEQATADTATGTIVDDG